MMARERLKKLLSSAEAHDEISEAFERSAGSWSDFDAEGFIKEIYERRSRGSERTGVEW